METRLAQPVKKQARDQHANGGDTHRSVFPKVFYAFFEQISEIMKPQPSPDEACLPRLLF